MILYDFFNILMILQETLHFSDRQVERDAAPRFVAVAQVAVEPDCEVHDGDHRQTGVEEAAKPTEMLFVLHFVFNWKHLPLNLQKYNIENNTIFFDMLIQTF